MPGRLDTGAAPSVVAHPRTQIFSVDIQRDDPVVVFDQAVVGLVPRCTAASTRTPAQLRFRGGGKLFDPSG